MSKKHRKGHIKVTPQLASAINKRAVDALRINVEHAAKLFEEGEEYAFSNSFDVNLRGWMLYQIMQRGASPKESIERMMEIVTDCFLPNFIEELLLSDELRGPLLADMLKVKLAEEDESEDSMMSRVNDMLKDKGFTPLVCAGDSIQDIIDQLTELQSAQGETKQ